MKSLRRRRARCALAAAVSWPLSTTGPSVGVSSRPMRLSRVDLPEPDWPMIGGELPALQIEGDVRERHRLDHRRRTSSPRSSACSSSQPPWITSIGSSLEVRREGMSDETSGDQDADDEGDRRRSPSCGVIGNGELESLPRKVNRVMRPTPTPTPTAAPHDAEDRRLPEEDAPGLAVAHAHRLEDADLARLLDRRDGQRRGDAERDRDQHEELDHVARAALALERREQVLVLGLPLRDLESLRAGLPRESSAATSLGVEDVAHLRLHGRVLVRLLPEHSLAA